MPIYHPKNDLLHSITMPTLKEIDEWLKRNDLSDDTRIFAGHNNDGTSDICADLGNRVPGFLDFPDDLPNPRTS